MVVQINGKTRDVMEVNKDMIENEIKSIILSKSKANKYLKEKKIIKTFFVKNKIINFIINN